MAVYNDAEGWQNKQFLGRENLLLPFWRLPVNITVPSDHVVAANRRVCKNTFWCNDFYSEKRICWCTWKYTCSLYDYHLRKKRRKRKKRKRKEQKSGSLRHQCTWFRICFSRKFIVGCYWRLSLGNRNCNGHVLIIQKRKIHLWEQYSTRAVAHTLRRLFWAYPLISLSSCDILLKQKASEWNTNWFCFKLWSSLKRWHLYRAN